MIKRHKLKILILLALGIWYYFCLPEQLFDVTYSTVLESSDGQLLDAHIAADEQWRFPEVDSVPYRYKQCVLQYEDAHFFSHPGFNPISILKALKQNIDAGRVVRGGSTITQQVIRLSRKRDRSYLEKIIELIVATRLELRHSKEEILELYASHAPYGGNVVGLEMASWRYFGRKPHDLSWAESAMLAVLPNAPGLIYPGQRSSILKDKRDQLLSRLNEEKIISDMEYDLALLEEIPLKDYRVPQLAPHLLQRARKEYGTQKITSTIEYGLQQRLNKIAENHYHRLAQNGVYNLSILVLDVENASVAGYVGNGPTTVEHGKDVDITTAPRSTGSVLKPFLYASMLDEGLLLPDTFVKDIPTTIDGYKTENYDRTYRGAVPASTALARSLNVPAVRMLQDYGVEKFYSRLQDLSLSDINRGASTYGLSLIIGGAESSLWDLSGSYLHLARDLKNYTSQSSQYDPEEYKPVTYVLGDSAFTLTPLNDQGTAGISTPLNDRRLGLSAESQRPKSSEKWSQDPNVFSAASIYHTFEAMKKVNRPEGEEIWHFFNPNRQIAWKTGTSFGNRDAWAIGITPKYVIGVWVGNADGEGRADLTGIDSAAPILFDVFNGFPAGAWFEKPYDDLIELEVCAASGHLAGLNCEETLQQYIPVKGERTPPCPYHQIIHLSENGSHRVEAGCYPIDKMQHKTHLVLPPAMSYYYAKSHASYERLPDYLKNCSAADEKMMRFIYPSHNTTISITKNRDGNLNPAIFELAHRNREKKVFWYVDDAFIKTTSGIHEVALIAEAGRHLISAVDEDGNSAKIYVNFE